MDARVAVVGASVDLGCTGEPGARVAPFEIRRRSHALPYRCAFDTGAPLGWFDVERRCRILERVTMADLGDVRAMPAGTAVPAVWLLGSGTRSAAYASYMGLSFSFAHFLGGDAGAQAVRAYTARFRASPFRPRPRASVAVAALCAETDSEADRLSASARLWFVRTEGKFTAPPRDKDGSLPSVDEAMAYRYSPDELAMLEAFAGRWIAGSPERVRGRILEIAERFGVEDILVMTLCHDPEARLRSYALLAEALRPETVA